jgi:hypothetical protein
VSGDCCFELRKLQAIHRGTLDRLILDETALLVLVAAAAVAGIIASGLWGGLGHVVGAVAMRRTHPCIKT